MHFSRASDMFMVDFDKLGIHLKISRVAFYITDKFPIYWYAICISIGFALAFFYTYKKSKYYRLNFDKFFDVVLVSAIFAFIGARLYYVIAKYDESFKGSFREIFNFRDGGLAIYGGIIAAFITGFVMCKMKKISVRATFDLAGVGFLIGQGIGRLGNFFNQEAFGINTNLPWGMYSEKTNEYLSTARTDLLYQGIVVDPSAPVHPCFLYELIWCLLGAFILSKLMKKRRYDGQVFLCYLVWYGVGRFFIEGLRTDSLMTMGGAVKLSQLVAAFLVLSSVILLVYFNLKYKKVSNENLQYTPQFKKQTTIEEKSEADIEAKSEQEETEENINGRLEENIDGQDN